MADGENQVFNALNSGAAFMRNRTARQRETQDFQDEQTARPLIGPALTGNPQAVTALGVAAPSLLMRITPHLQRMDATQLARSKQLAETRGAFAGGILSLDPKDQPGAYPIALEQLRQSGQPVDHLPQQWGPQVPGVLRTMRAMSNEYQKHINALELKKTPPGKAAGVGHGGGFDFAPGVTAAPISPPTPVVVPDQGDTPANAPVAQAPQARMGAPNTAPPVDDQNTGPAPVGWQAAGPDQPAPAPVAAPQQPNIPAGFQAMGHRGPDGKLAPALMDGKPVYRTPTGELTTQIPQGDQTPDAGPQAAPRPGPPLAPGGMAQVTGGAVAAPPAPAGPIPTRPTVTPPATPQQAPAAPAPAAAPPTRQPRPPYAVPPGLLPPGNWIQGERNGVTVMEKNGEMWAVNPQTKQAIPYKPQITERAQPPPGYTHAPNGGLAPIPGGPADPEVVTRQTEARRTASEKVIPQTIAKGMQENLDALRQIDRTLEKLDANPKGVGNTADYIQRISPQWGGDLNNKVLNPGGAELRALIADIGSLKIHDRSGAAVTISETPRLIPFIPQITDDVPTIKKKLANFRNVYEQTLLDTTGYYNPDNGFKAYTPAQDYLEGKTKTAGPGEQARNDFNAAKGPKPGTVEQGYRFKGGNPADKTNWEKVQ